MANIMEKEKNILLMVNYYMKENGYLVKLMEKEENLIEMVI